MSYYVILYRFRPRTHGNVFLRFCIVSSNELVVLDSLENSKQYKNAGKRFRVYGALHAYFRVSSYNIAWLLFLCRYTLTSFHYLYKVANPWKDLENWHFTVAQLSNQGPPTTEVKGWSPGITYFIVHTDLKYRYRTFDFDRTWPKICCWIVPFILNCSKLKSFATTSVQTNK